MGFVKGQNAGQWNDERVKELKQLWDKGLSAGLIATRMTGFTRNAIIGKVHRLGLPGRPTPIGKFRTKSGTAARRPVSRPKIDKIRSERVYITKQVLPAAPLPPEPPKPSKLFKLVDLEDNQCRFPFGDPKSKDFGFCGCVKAAGSSYCPGHAHLTSTAPNVKVPSIPIEWNYQRKVRVRVGTVERERVE